MKKDRREKGFKLTSLHVGVILADIEEMAENYYAIKKYFKKKEQKQNPGEVIVFKFIKKQYEMFLRSLLKYAEENRKEIFACMDMLDDIMKTRKIYRQQENR